MLAAIISLSLLPDWVQTPKSKKKVRQQPQSPQFETFIVRARKECSWPTNAMQRRAHADQQNEETTTAWAELPQLTRRLSYWSSPMSKTQHNCRVGHCQVRTRARKPEGSGRPRDLRNNTEGAARLLRLTFVVCSCYAWSSPIQFRLLENLVCGILEQMASTRRTLPSPSPGSHRI